MTKIAESGKIIVEKENGMKETKMFKSLNDMFKSVEKYLKESNGRGQFYCYGFDDDKEDQWVEEPESEIASILVNENKRVVTVIFSDGDVKMSKCSEKDEFDIKVGVALCILYHMFGSNTKASKVIEKKAKIIKKEEIKSSTVKTNKTKIKVSKNNE